MNPYIFDESSTYIHATIPGFRVVPVSRHEKPSGGHSVWVRSEKDGTKLNYDLEIFLREFSLYGPLNIDPEKVWREWQEIEKAHSWVYGHRDVWCSMCKKSKGDPNLTADCIFGPRFQ